MSSHPISQKRGIITNLVDKVLRLSHPKFHAKNRNIATAQLNKFLHRKTQKNVIDNNILSMVTSTKEKLLAKKS